MLSGLPASGKSTKAKEIIEGGGNFIRLNRDLLREMLHFNVWSNNHESQVIEVEKLIARELLEDNINVIIDDTNLTQNHEDMWKEICGLSNATFEKIVLDTPVDECVLRNSLREKKVPESVIKNFDLRYRKDKIATKGIVLCDIDGTIANLTHRLHYVKKPEGEKKDWKRFFSNMDLDLPIHEVINRVKALQEEGYMIVCISGRPEDYREVTETWVKRFMTPYTFLMRRSGDSRSNDIVKEELLNNYLGGYTIHKVFDDQPSVIRMWNRNKLDVVDCGNGVEF